MGLVVLLIVHLLLVGCLLGIGLLLSHGLLLLAVDHGLVQQSLLLLLLLLHGLHLHLIVFEPLNFVLLLLNCTRLPRTPKALEVNGAHPFALVSYLPPVIEASRNAKGAQLNGG